MLQAVTQPTAAHVTRQWRGDPRRSITALRDSRSQVRTWHQHARNVM